MIQDVYVPIQTYKCCLSRPKTGVYPGLKTLPIQACHVSTGDAISDDYGQGMENFKQSYSEFYYQAQW